MPFYNCFCPASFLSNDAKKRIARGITDIHCGLTGAPRQFVHVIFSEYTSENGFSAGEPSRASLVRGFIRVGRTQEVKEELLREISELWIREAGTPPENLLVSLSENPGTNAMEGGVLLPHPKDDEAWLREHQH